MPYFNGTGPDGYGPGTGRGLGPCGAGMARGRGFGRGRGFFGRAFGFGRNNSGTGYSLQDRKEWLKQELRAIEEEENTSN
ncbi:MAG: DUF5320 domain-containing protein [Candidatus Colwellbacteria bacterium]|jgi:hypothetical protein|nr:DUF5320 domain-containing protein [Candidatus Colwellbacteria bacterium]MCK9497245.1 DUF5320 domain-containing protein [Candidatus Colwellbacteria bacterium]MDD3752386.1 DUF5320 domain-containing protein [Candidatus Colwellbacteria bacterium]MDD4818649.1 DUF5320 domain-containing protein [Candidatus Colwellbacteria bacterium]